MDPTWIESLRSLGVAAPIIIVLIWLVVQQQRTIKSKDAEIARLNDGDRALLERMAPLLADAAKVLADAMAELRRRA